MGLKVASRKPSIGYIYYKNKSYFDPDNFLIMRALEDKVNIVRLPIEEQIDLDEIREKTKECHVIYNNAIFDPLTFESLQLSKTLEELGKKVINSTHSFFYKEDKWMFYLKCLERKLPTPKTYLIPRWTRFNSVYIKSLLKNGPIVLKAVWSDNGDAVELVRTVPDFKNKIKKLLRKDLRAPIVAQEFLPNKKRSYRVTLIGKKVKQAVVKIGKNWKQKGTDDGSEQFRTVKLTRELTKMCEKAARAFRMDLCGLDLIFSKGKWYIIEANSCPGIDFINHDTARMRKELANFLAAECFEREH